MDQKNFIQSILPTLLLLFATVGGWIAKPVDFSKGKPEATVRASLAQHDLQTIESRLWKDPFAGLPDKSGLKDIGALNGALGRLDVLRDELKEVSPDKKRPLVIIALVHSANTAFESESRLRQRHAVLAGLGVAGYVPTDEAHLGFLAVPWERRAIPPGPLKHHASEKIPPEPPLDHGAPLIGTFEWFEPANKQRKLENSAVLVLWVPEREFEENPMQRIAQLMDKLGRSVANRFSLAILGPRTTGGLFAFCEEAEMAAKKGWSHVRRLGGEAMFSVESALAGAQFYSASATTTDELLPPYCLPKSPEGSALRGRPMLAEQLRKVKVSFRDFAADDRKVTDLLVQELQVRGVKPADSDKILLLSEWHSDYGRALPLTFAANWARRVSAAAPPGADCEHGGGRGTSFGERIRSMQRDPAAEFPKQLIRVGYVSGVDGDRKAVAASGAAGGDKQPGVSTPDAALYPAFGESQFDYVERLAARLDREFGEARVAGAESGRVVAIGVLGSDFYDKLHLMQALRPKFPQALFFTTDLDARMSAADTRPWMKNVLVGSSWRLDADAFHPTNSGNPFSAASIPPFRDSYQTAIYHAVKKALSSGAPSGDFPQARLFEVGRTHPVELRPLIDEAGLGFEVLARLILLYLGIGAVLVAGSLWKLRAGGAVKAFGRPLIERRDWANRVILGRLKLGPALDRCREQLALQLVRHRLIAGLFFLVAACWAAQERSANGMLLVCLCVLVVGGLSAFEISPGRESGKGEPWHPFSVMTATLGGILGVTLIALIVVPEESLRMEPFFWLEGVSLWPAEIVRVAAGLLGVYWIWATHREILTKGEKLKNDYSLEWAGTAKPSKEGSAVVARMIWERFRVELKMGDSWKPGKFRQAGWVWTGTGVLMVFWLYFAYWQPEPLRAPYRGNFSYIADVVVLVAVMLVYTFLLLQVFDISRKTRVFIHELAQKPTVWSNKVIRKSVGRGAIHTAGPNVDGWLDVRFVAELTHTVGDLVIRPFVILFLLLAATSHDFFDTWSMNQPYIVTLAVVNASLPLLCGYFLCREAEKARSAAATRLQDALIKAEAPDLKGKYELMLREIKECRRGAFRPIYEQPYVIALLIPLGGSGSIEIIKRLLNA